MRSLRGPASRGSCATMAALMAALLVFSGTQLVLLGLIGEYIGRMFLAVNQRPQSVVRKVERGGGKVGFLDQ